MNMRMRVRRGFRRLNVRLFIPLAAVILLFQLMLALFIMNYFTGQYQEQMVKLGMTTLSNAGYTISSAFARMEEAVYSLSYNDTVQKYLNITSTQSDYYIVTVQKETTSLMRAFSAQCLPGVDYTIYATGEKKGITSTIDSLSYINYGYKYQAEPWYIRITAEQDARKIFLANQSVQRFVSFIETPKHLFVYRIHRFNTLMPNGYLVLQFDASTFDEMIGEMPSAIQNVLIVDADGNTLYENMSFLTRDQLMDDADQNQGTIRTMEYKSYVPVTQTIDSLGWEIVCTVDADAYAASIRALRNICLVFMTISAVALLILVYVISRRITRPVARLSAGMENIRLGQYDVSLPVERDDEIGLLTESFNGMAHQLLDANERLKRYEALQQSISFYALQQQINPHFLYNTLDMIIGMATEKGTDQVILVCQCLASLFRYNLSRELTVPLKRELDHVKNYLTILELRNPGQFEILFDVDEAVLSIYMPKLVLQPLIENCVKHAAKDRQERLLIAISARREPGNMLRVEIVDDGVGFSPAQLLTLNREFAKRAANIPDDHIGILNICERLRLIYAEAFSMDVRNGEEGGAVVALLFPMDVPISLV